MSANPGDITILLSEIREGDPRATDLLMERVYPELRRMASAYMHRERAEHTLQPTGLVHEAYLRMLHGQEIDWQNRLHFMAVAALVMRRVLVEHARTRNAMRRGGGLRRTYPDFDGLVAPDAEAAELLDVDSALRQLEKIDPRLSRTVELRYFGGLSAEETAEVLGVSTKTVQRDWIVAKGWLRTELSKGGYGRGEPLAQS